MRQMAKFIPWLPTVLGIVGLLVAVVFAAVRLIPDNAVPVTLPPPVPAFTLPGTTSGPQVPVSLLPAPPASLSPAPPAGLVTESTAKPAPRRTATAAAGRTAPRGPVTGRYQVTDSFPDSFIGQVLITNDANDARDWTVVLTFPSGVGDLRTSWLESLPQPTRTQNGHTFTWRSTVPLAAGSTGALRFQFDRSGSAEKPSRCTVNGVPCRL